MRLLWRPRWLLVHAAVVVLVVAFLALGYWQLNRFAGGNALSFGYALEWPAFAAFTVYVWIKEMRRAVTAGTGETPEPEVNPPARRLQLTGASTERTHRARTGAAYDDSDDDELAAYNRYLAWLNAHPDAPTSEYPG
jgi:DNA-binding transcriptional regulator of glucitol operon